MFTYEIQFLSRAKDDYEDHRNAAMGVEISGKIGFRCYFFGGIRNLIVRLENEEDMKSVIEALPRQAFVGIRRFYPHPRDLAA